MQKLALSFYVFFIIALTSKALANDVLAKEVFDIYNTDYNTPAENININLAAPINTTLFDAPSTVYDFNVSLDPVGESFDDITDDAFLALKKGHYEAADILYRKALAIDPENVDILFSIGYANQMLGKFEIAKQFYRTVLKQDQYYTAAFRNFFTILAKQNPNDAITKLQALALGNPYHPVIISELSYIYRMVGNTQLALKYILKALRIEPHNSSYYCKAGLIYEDMKDYETAKDFYAQSLKNYDKTGECSDTELKQKIAYLKAMR